ncbi:UPF0764 protein C16orf89 homolog [Phymastichus coffea]|uniref:UPF0764 protein C16orf89 homolog n=1 Tax=Phymastichus coffea TaxID=108790 RepID=UPI00273C1A6A|nr:UPF0764 protein C16orf89 homolog [Phymastichus coffea]
MQNFTYFTLKFCSLMLQNLVNFEAMDFPYISKDLASEQILLCGMEGYADFLSNHYENLIMNWQHPSGCYSGLRYSPHFQQSFKMRKRRSGNFTDFGCVNHATGLGAAVLALFIRKDIEMLREMLLN